MALCFLYVSDSATFCKLLEHSQVRPETPQDYLSSYNHSLSFYTWIFILNISLQYFYEASLAEKEKNT